MPKSLSFLGKILSKKSNNQKPFLALELSEDKKVKLAIWQIKEGKREILKKRVEQFKGEGEEIVFSLSEIILDLIKKEGLENKVRRVIFGLPKAFVEEDKIKSPHKTILKKICQQLSLIPLGFVETPAAIAFLLKEKEGHPPTAILLKVAKDSFSFNVFKIGKDVGSKTVSYKDDLALKLSQALGEFSDLQTFPTQIFLYDGEENLEEAKQELLSFPWQKEAGFLHFPKIEILDEDFSLLALIAAGSNEFAKEIPEIMEKKVPIKEEVSLQDLGFLKDEDIAEKEALLVTKEEDASEEKEEGEVLEEKIKEEKEIEVASDEEIEEPGPSPLFSLTEAIRSFLANMSFKPNLKRMAIILSLLGVILGGVLLYLFWFFPRATIVLLVEPYSLEEDAEVVLNLSSEALDQSVSQIQGRKLTVERKTAEKIAVSSKKEVGDSSRGEVTVYNKTTNTKIFSKGAVILGPKNLKFTLDQDVAVASLSDVIAGTPGKEKVKVTAVEIGPEGNLGAGSDFTFKDFPVTSYAARNEKAFSGGTSREVTVVGKKDQDELLKRLEEKLTNQAKEGLTEELDPSEKLLVETVEGQVLEKKFDHDVGEETDELSLDLSMSFKGAAYKGDDLVVLLRKMLQENAPPGYKFDKEKVEMEISSVEKEKDKILFNAHFKVELLPEIKEGELKKKLAGKRVKEVEDYFRSQSNLAGFEIKFVSSPFLMKKTLPLNSQKISIEIQTL